MFLINILTSFYHLKAKFSKTIILIMRVIAHFEVLFPIEETMVKSVITYSKLNSSNMFRQSQVFSTLCTGKYWGKLKKTWQKILFNHIFCAILISLK